MLINVYKPVEGLLLFTVHWFIKGGVSPDTMSHIWKVAVQPVLSYATQSLFIRKSD